MNINEVKVLTLVDDHGIVRKGLKELIEKLGPFEVRHEYENGKELIDNKDAWQDTDLILLDLEMPVMNGQQTMKWIFNEGIKWPVLVLTLTENEDTIIGLFKLGVRGYLHKNCTAEALNTAITEILITGYYHSEMLTKALLNNGEDHKKSKISNNQLSEREVEFLKLVCDEHEYTYDQIAGIMNLSRRTVDGYRESIFEKFNIKSKTGLVLFALKCGLL